MTENSILNDLKKLIKKIDAEQTKRAEKLDKLEAKRDMSFWDEQECRKIYEAFDAVSEIEGEVRDLFKKYGGTFRAYKIAPRKTTYKMTKYRKF